MNKRDVLGVVALIVLVGLALPLIFAWNWTFKHWAAILTALVVIAIASFEVYFVVYFLPWETYSP